MCRRPRSWPRVAGSVARLWHRRQQPVRRPRLRRRRERRLPSERGGRGADVAVGGQKGDQIVGVRGDAQHIPELLLAAGESVCRETCPHRARPRRSWCPRQVGRMYCKMQSLKMCFFRRDLLVSARLSTYPSGANRPVVGPPSARRRPVEGSMRSSGPVSMDSFQQSRASFSLPPPDLHLAFS